PPGQAELSERGGVGAQLVGDRPLGRKTLLLEQLAYQPHGRPFIAARLDQQIEDFTLLVDGTPEIHAPARSARSGECSKLLGKALALASRGPDRRRARCAGGVCNKSQCPLPVVLIPLTRPDKLTVPLKV